MLPSAFEIVALIAASPRVYVFLDFDGTLTPIVERPEWAVLAPHVRRSIARLAEVADVAVVSGRALEQLIPLIALDTIAYAGSHGLEVQRADGRRTRHGDPDGYSDDVLNAAALLQQRLAREPGVMIERKPFSVAVHYPHDTKVVESLFRARVRTLCAEFTRLEVLTGKHVLEFRPRSGWHKGSAIELLLSECLEPRAAPVVLGDDLTDEDGFRAVEHRGYGIRVGAEPEWRTAARYSLQTPADVHEWIELLTARLVRESVTVPLRIDRTIA